MNNNGADIDRRRGIGRFGGNGSIGGIASDPDGPTARHQRRTTIDVPDDPQPLTEAEGHQQAATIDLILQGKME